MWDRFKDKQKLGLVYSVAAADLALIDSKIDFYTRWIQKEGRFTLQGVLLCRCKERNILNKVESLMIACGEHDGFVRSRSAVLLRLRDHVG